MPSPYPEQDQGVIRDAALSDLFFNYDHPTYDGLVKQDGLEAINEKSTDEERYAALLADAKDFCQTLDNATGVRLDPEAVVIDFFGRL